MIRKYEYHLISFIIFAFHINLFIKKLYFNKWVWDFIHIYFCGLFIYCTFLTFYAIRIFILCKNLDLKYHPIESITSCKDYKNAKNLHPYSAFERSDLIYMKLHNLLYGTLFMATWKIVIILFVAFLNVFLCITISFITRNSDNNNNRILRIYLSILRKVCRLAMWIFGINIIENNYLCDNEWPKNIVSNHISALDPFYFIAEHACSFVAKKSIKEDRLIGLSAQSLKCVFVYREKSEDRKKALELIKERQVLVNNKVNNYPSFVIFSEGTTSNGLQLIEQKRGAFFSLQAITPVLLVYDYTYFNPSYDIIPFNWWFFFFATNYESIILKTYWLPKVDPPTEEECKNLSEEEIISIFHDKVSKVMFENMKKYNPKAPKDIDNYIDWPGSLRLKMEYFQKALGKVATKHLKKEQRRSEK